jgi:hypothetical protein
MAGEKKHEEEKKLCSIDDVGKDRSTFDSYRKLVKDPQFICKGCGRAAKHDANLCSPEKM